MAMLELVDTHCHLYEDLLGEDPAGAIARARTAGVLRLVVPAYDLASWPRMAALQRYEGVFLALGLHPWVADEPLDEARLAAALTAQRAVAVGEIGLDFAIAGANRARQVAVLRTQLAVARELDLPVILHCRQAFEELAELLRPLSPGLRGVLHAFSRGPEVARRFLALGLHLGLGGAITRPRAERARRSAAELPLDRLVLETDAPSIGLEGIEPAAVEPAHTAQVAATLARLRGEPLAEVAARTTENARALFGLDDREAAP